MSNPADISPAIVHALYLDALALAEETRSAFDLSGRLEAVGEGGELMRVALSCEALRTTTRMMHAIAWLLNQRAYLEGELSEFQLRRHGRLPPNQCDADSAQLALLDPALQDLVQRTQRFHARIARLDRAWRDQYTIYPTAVHRLRERLGVSLQRM